MSRQMRGEILSLDLASLTSRIHTLTYSTLSSSAKVLDAMVDAAPVPLPESFLDKQDDLEIRAKEDLQSVGDFAHGLAKQWRQADEAYWTCKEVQLASQALSRDISQATLKLPSESLAKDYENRLDVLLATLDKVNDTVIDKLPTPTLPALIPNQGMCNLQVTDALRAVIRDTSGVSKAAQQAVQAYRDAARAFAAAQSYSQEITKTLTSLRQASSALRIVPVQLSVLTDDTVDLQVAQAECEALAGQSRQAQDGVAGRSQGVIQELLANGIDTNVRRSLQDSVSALTREAKQTLVLAQRETLKIAALRDSRNFVRSQEATISTLKFEEETIKAAVKTVLCAENAESFTFDTKGMKERLVALHQQARLHQESQNAVFKSLDDLQVTSDQDQRTEIVSYLQARLDDIANRLDNTDELADLLQRALKQRTEIDTVAQAGAYLDCELRTLRDGFRMASVKDDTIEELHQRQLKLQVQCQNFNSSLVEHVPFLAKAVPTEGLHLEAHDSGVRERFNQNSTHLAALVSSIEEMGTSLRNARDIHKRLEDDRSSIQGILAQAEFVVSNPETQDPDKLKQLQILKRRLGVDLSRTSLETATRLKILCSKTAYDELTALRDSTKIESQLLEERLNSMVNEYAGRVREAEARQRRAQEEDEQRQKRLVAERGLKRMQEEHASFDQACVGLEKEITKCKSVLDETAWHGGVGPTLLS